ncbi:MAG TPA: DUF3293 domain-containing protein [Accumulibacter sp.]|nr:DUF3293 domain-containing protein [Accumulibacter sp.]HPP46645.1 DUF3293 domain-containing protein [Accumulibacter sp.]
MSVPALLAAFTATTYRVSTPDGICNLRVGAPQPAFDAALSAWQAGSSLAANCGRTAVDWAIITAFNPGMPLAEQENVQRQARLQADIEQRGWAYWPACNLADDGCWPDEASFLLLQVAESEVVALARQFGQVALLVGRQGGAPRLLWVDDDAAAFCRQADDAAQGE